MLGPDDLVLCSGTLSRPARGGARGNGRRLPRAHTWPTTWRARAGGVLIAGWRGIAGTRPVADLDPLLRWLPDEAVPPGFAGEPEFYEIAEAVGARSLNVAQGFGARVDLDRAAEALAGVCDRAREHGLLVTLEYLPWSGIPDARAALTIVERSGRANATLMIDTWHTFRGPTDDAQLRALPGARVGSVQLNAAPVTPAANLVAETMEARLAREGIPRVRWLRILDAIAAAFPTASGVRRRSLRLPTSRSPCRRRAAPRSAQPRQPGSVDAEPRRAAGGRPSARAARLTAQLGSLRGARDGESQMPKLRATLAGRAGPPRAARGCLHPGISLGAVAGRARPRWRTGARAPVQVIREMDRGARARPA